MENTNGLEQIMFQVGVDGTNAQETLKLILGNLSSIQNKLLAIGKTPLDISGNANVGTELKQVQQAMGDITAQLKTNITSWGDIGRLAKEHGTNITNAEAKAESLNKSITKTKKEQENYNTTLTKTGELQKLQTEYNNINAKNLSYSVKASEKLVKLREKDLAIAKASGDSVKVEEAKIKLNEALFH